MKNVLIFGSGSIGNHMAYACRKNSMNVYVTDNNNNALKRMKEKIYPKRYGFWDDKIKLIKIENVVSLVIFFDLIIIGTPPDTHIPIYNFCKKKLKYKKILIEKPLSNYLEKNLNSFQSKIKKDMVFCGYNHSISPSFKFFLTKLNKNKNIKKIYVNWCEAWDGILNAHFWMKNPYDSYLGDVKKGGGALQEHSHGLHIMLLLLKELNINLNNIKIGASSIFESNGKKKYDIFSNITGFHKRIYFNYNTDLFTFPAEKKITIICSNRKYEWICNFKKNVDLVKITSNEKNIYFKKFAKTRSSEFENEIKHILKIKTLSQKNDSNLNPKYAINTLRLIKKILKNEHN